MISNMATNTAIYDSEIKIWQDRLETARTVQDVETAKNKLISLFTDKWKSVTSIFDLDIEIERRLYKYKSGDTNEHINPTTYARWKSVLQQYGKSDYALFYARNLISVSDQTAAIRAARNKKDQLQGKTTGDTIASSTVTETEHPEEDTTGTVTRSSDGTYRLLTPAEIMAAAPKVNIDLSSANATAQKTDPRLLDKRPAWIDTNIEQARTKTVEGLISNSAYIKRYFSVIDAEVYFGNEYVEDIHDINWSVQQQVMPLFGFNSYTYDEVARGNRIIVGSFTINFTNPNYLFSILKAADKANTATVSAMASYSVPKLDKSKVTNRTSAYGAREAGHNTCLWPQTFDIDIIFGEKSEAGDPVHVIILGVALQNCQTVLSASAAGSPPAVMEQYSFIAQDIRTVVVSENDATGYDFTNLGKSKKSNSSTANTEQGNSDTTDTKQSNNDTTDKDQAKVTNADEDDELTYEEELAISEAEQEAEGEKEKADWEAYQKEKAKEAAKDAEKQKAEDKDETKEPTKGVLLGKTQKTDAANSQLTKAIAEKVSEAKSKVDYVDIGKESYGSGEERLSVILTASGYVGKPISDPDLCVLLARQKTNLSVGEPLSDTEKDTLDKALVEALNRGEYFKFKEGEGQSFEEYKNGVAFVYYYEYNGKLREGSWIYTEDEIQQLLLRTNSHMNKSL